MTRKSIALVMAATLWACIALGFGAPQAGNTLEAALARMDETAAKFKGITANIRRLSRTEVVEKEEVEEGTIAAKKIKPKDTHILIKMTTPDTKFYFVGGGKAVVYNPKSMEAQEANLGRSKETVNQLLLLSFGSNSADLKSAYTIKLGAAETVNGEKATRLELTPKSADVLKYVKRCDMWITDKGMAVQQKFFQPGGDYVLTTYRNMTMAPNLPDSAVKLDIPHDVKVTKLK